MSLSDLPGPILQRVEEVSLSDLPGPILQRVEYEFGDPLNVKKIEKYPSPKKSYEKGSIGRALSADE
ncbi:MAG: hypothetical protein O7G88_01210, partial [bacterium]|nr:hypothetical protein [bacterium]